MNSVLQGHFTSVMGVTSREGLLAEVVAFTKHLGFVTVDAMVVVDHVPGESEFILVNNAPPGFRDVAHCAEDGLRDPVMQHCKRASVPIVWNQDTYTSARQGDLWEVQARFGYCTGITVASHLPRGLHFCIGVDRDRPLPRTPVEVTRMVADLQLFAAHAQDAALRVLLPPKPQEDSPDLTRRELESLRWTMEGKTAWELGRILGISEQTAVRHVNNAARKLDCVNKHHAVVKALRLGLIR